MQSTNSIIYANYAIPLLNLQNNSEVNNVLKAANSMILTLMTSRHHILSKSRKWFIIQFIVSSRHVFTLSAQLKTAITMYDSAC